MIRPHEHASDSARGGRPPLRLVYCTFWTSGPDPAQDGLVRLSAANEDGSEEFDLLCAPFSGAPESWGCAERLKREFGLDAEELAGASDPARAWDELARFALGATIVVADLESFDTWRAHFSGGDARFADALGLCELAALFTPGRWSSRREELVPLLLAGEKSARPRAFGPAQLAQACHELLGRVRKHAPETRRLAFEGYARAAAGLRESDALLARRLGLALALVGVEHAGAQGGSLEDLIETLEPRWTQEGERWAELAPLPPAKEGALAFPDEDFERLDRVFQKHLPERFARENPDVPSSYRAGQHQVAREVARTLASEELLLVHAPTGTGKTLSYLVPLLLWARRHEVRTGVATFTRALQEQAYDRELPRALAALAQEGIPGGLRVSLLKGRENYVCWRALRLALPSDDEDGAAWLAWTQLVLFALGDLEGDLDRLPLRPPLPSEASVPLFNAASELRRSARAQTACCTQRDDKRTCAANQARVRAERSHVVIVNQAFALAVPEFCRHVVFDECEHLHDQAHNACSKLLSLRTARAVLARLSQPGRTASRAPLDRLARLLPETTASERSLAQCRKTVLKASGALELLAKAAQAFLDWRALEEATLASYSDGPDGQSLVAARVEFGAQLRGLEGDLAELSARLSSQPARALSQPRRQLDLVQVELATLAAALDAWMPLEEDRPSFRPNTYYDVERDARGDLVLASRVLLPNEFLGRSYYPMLANAVFLSATTWIAGGFEAARGYLGLDRAASPAADEERPGMRVRDFRAPDPFDYGRVLVAIPTDAPSAAQDSKAAFLEYVRRFVAHLGERTRGRMLVLFTNAADARRVGEELGGFFRARRIPLWFQNQEGTVKEELSDLFRARVDSVLLGVDTFWYGADFPGETLEYLVIVKLPFGVPDRYHEAQCAALGAGEQRKRIYMPRALAKFRQGFGRLMRRESDRGVVFVLDARLVQPRQRAFLRELPLEDPFETLRDPASGLRKARLVRGDTERCLREAFTHMNLGEDLRRRGLSWSFAEEEEPQAGEELA